jgi:hypothetical protein
MHPGKAVAAEAAMAAAPPGIGGHGRKKKAGAQGGNQGKRRFHAVSPGKKYSKYVHAAHVL